MSHLISSLNISLKFKQIEWKSRNDKHNNDNEKVQRSFLPHFLLNKLFYIAISNAAISHFDGLRALSFSCDTHFIFVFVLTSFDSHIYKMKIIA